MQTPRTIEFNAVYRNSMQHFEEMFISSFKKMKKKNVLDRFIHTHTEGGRK